MAVRAPKSLKAARRLCELYAEIDGRIAAMEEARDVAIAKANAMVDADLAPLLKERAAIEEKLEPWFLEARGELLNGKRKSIELGGCELGTRKGGDALVIAGDEGALVVELEGARWAQPLLRRSVSLDKRAIKAAMQGPKAARLEALGVGIEAGGESFFVKRTQQGGTQVKIGV